MRRTFCARCHAIGLGRCAHPTRATGPGGKHRARETYRVHPAKTFVNVPTSPFLFSAAGTATKDTLAESFTPVSSTKVITGQTTDQFSTLMHELWVSPGEPVGDLPEKLPSHTKEPTETMRRSLVLVPVVLLIIGVIGWGLYRPAGPGIGSNAVPAETMIGLTTELAALPSTISEILEEGTPGVQLSEAATSLTRWSTQVSALMSASVAIDPAETDSATVVLLDTVGTDARALQALLSDALSTRLIVGALDVSPELPQEATLDQVTDLRVSLALGLDNARTRLSLLPTSSADMERELLGMLSDMERDHALYLSALLNEETGDPSTPLESLAATQRAIDSSLSTYLLSQRPQADNLLSAIEALLGSLD